MVVRTDDADWIEFPVGAVEFLAGVHGRAIDVPGTPRDFPGDDPKVLGPGDRADRSGHLGLVGEVTGREAQSVHRECGEQGRAVVAALVRARWFGGGVVRRAVQGAGG